MLLGNVVCETPCSPVDICYVWYAQIVWYHGRGRGRGRGCAYVHDVVYEGSMKNEIKRFEIIDGRQDY